ncbi:MAG: DUF839 domain-containing protein, partial [Chloroflexi bacterium]|nr:DUF839 domain-containing protein [Chloroflexota bacterium]
VLAAAPALAQDPTIPPSDLTSPIAPFVFSHEVAIANGATAEFRKMEGVGFDAASNELYYAITAIAKGMSDGAGDLQMTESPCGAILGGTLDTASDLSSLSTVVAGGPYAEANADYACNPDSISNPDNIFVDPKGNLWIGEDTDFHHNQMLWMWDGTTLQRFATLPEGAEVTGLRIEPDGTMFLNIQHPSATNTYPFNRATVGVINGYKAGDAFTPVAVPTGDAMRTLTMASGTYQVLARTGEPIPGALHGQTFGAITAPDGKVIDICNNPDGNMYLPTASDGTQGYLYSNWECVPGGVSKLYITEGTDGTWTATDGDTVDFLAVGGTQNNCNASVTPWNTALTSEEYPPDVQGEYDEFVATKDALSAQVGRAANPLEYGYNIELTPAGGEDNGIGTTVVKHYVMGRFSKEMALVMPDSKTAYFGDDGTDRVLYKFVADTAGDLSAGTLSAAKVTQDGDTLGITWIPLGSGNDADIAAGLKAMEEAY